MALIIAAVMLLAGSASAEQPPTKLRKLIDESIGWYEVLPSEESDQPMKPVLALRWPNTVRGSTDGATVLWIAEGRPEAVTAIYAWGDNFVHEFDSLSRGMIVAKRDGKVVWNPETPGLQFRPIEGASAPGRKAQTRLSQMKALAKQFKATFLGWKSDNSQVERLRMMSTPLYRYDIEKPDRVQDGVVMAYVSGTDPEVLLVIEAYGEPGRYRWQYAFVRRSSAGLQGRFRDQIVWAAQKYPQRWVPTKNHIALKRPLEEVLEPEDGASMP